MIIKICGITNPIQAKEISKLGADYIGVITYKKSPRYVNFETIKKIKETINGKTKLVVVVVNPTKEEAEKYLEVADFVQFHGDEDIDFIKNFPKEKVIKALRIKDDLDISNISPYIKENIPILIDTYKEGMYGGTGEMQKLETVKKILDIYDKVIISGGLSEENIDKVLKHIKPYGVDASSKLEKEPGIKNIEKVKKFIGKVRSYESDS